LFRSELCGTIAKCKCANQWKAVVGCGYHAFHKKNCLDAIAAGKHVLCEKAFTITSKEAEAVFAAARAKDIFIMEAMWTRFTPLVLTLQKKLFEEKVIGDVRRTFCDFGLDMDIAPLGVDSRLKSPGLGAGSLLDIGISDLGTSDSRCMNW
jgi:predicted dehydrogenase